MGKIWTKRRDLKKEKLSNVSSLMTGKFVDKTHIIDVLERIIEPYDKVVLEGNNQKQADFLARSLLNVNNKKIHDLHLIMPSVSRAEHLDLFDKGIAGLLDFAFAGPQSVRISRMIETNQIKIGDIHTYLELYGRLFVDLIPNVVLVAADKADVHGNLYTGYNTEETPTIIEAAAFKDGIVVVQVNEIIDELPRVDIPNSWVDIIVESDKQYQLEALFTRDPQNITEIQVLMGMMALKGIYQKHNVQSLNHGIGFNTAAIELLLPTYGEELGLRGKVAKNWVLNPHPTLIPAIESGFVESVHSFGGEVGMEKYIAARPDVFFVGADGTMRSNRVLCQVAGQYAVDMFIGSTLQLDYQANSSTVTTGRLSGFGGAPNMGHNPGGRRHATPAWMDLKNTDDRLSKGQKLVVQMVETYGANKKPVFVESLDAINVQKEADLSNVPIMVYSQDTTHVVTEEGIAYLYKTSSQTEKEMALAAIAGVTPLGMSSTVEALNDLRQRGIVALPEDLEIKRTQAKRTMLAAQTIDDLVEYSGGLYMPPSQFRTWS